jgi:DNA repair protein RadC
MKYALRTVTWKFKTVEEPIPELAEKSSVVIKSPSDIYNNYKSLFIDKVKERFVVFWLDTAGKVLGFDLVSEGTLDSSLVHAREVFRGAVVATASAIILAHNHPSNSLEPSKQDIEITKQLVQAGLIIDIPIKDHVIFGTDHYTSFVDRGYM